MAWSLSKDDDGLDSVVPPAGSTNRPSQAPRTPSTTPRVFASQSLGVSASSAPAEQGLQGGGASVVVDPSSQIPQALDSSPSHHYAAVERTQVLKGRRLDNLRAEVRERRKAYKRRKLRVLALWGVAGGGALLLGALAANSLFGAEASEQKTVAEVEQTLGAGELVVEPSEAKNSTDKGVKSNAVAGEKAGAKKSKKQVAAPDSAARPNDEKSDDTGAFTLDDLPLE